MTIQPDQIHKDSVSSDLDVFDGLTFGADTGAYGLCILEAKMSVFH
jgi:hypothetical protein